jgi:hypothetical protein
MTTLTYDSLDKVPDDLRPHARAEEGGSTVTVKVAPFAKVEEFRNNNIEYRTKAEKAEERTARVAEILGLPANFADKDLEEASTKQKGLVELRKKVDDKELLGTQGLEEALAKRTSEMRETHSTQLREKAAEARAWQDKAEKSEKSLQHYVIRDHINRAVLDPKSGIRHEALDDILVHANNTFRVDVAKNRIVPYEGDAIIYGENGTDPMTPLDWLKKLSSTRPHYVVPSQGGGAGGGSGGGAGGGNRMTPEQISKLSQPEYEKARKEGRA